MFGYQQKVNPFVPAFDAIVSLSLLVSHLPASLGAEPSVADSLAALRTQAGVEVSLFAAEPDVVDPVAARFDEHGRLWVVEMRDYPTGPVAGAKPNGQIRVLVDHDHDGKPDVSHTFASGLVFPTGIQPWRDGVIATVAGKLVYFVDMDGDLQADREEIWFEGFTEDNEQLRANHPVMAPDGLIYVANGLRGGKIISRDPRWSSDAPVDLAGMDFAFDPRGGFFGGVTGNSQFGLTIDDFGHRIGCSNRNPAMETLLQIEDVRANRWSGPATAFRDVSKAGGDSEVRPITEAWTTSHLHGGQFSAACGVLRGLGTGVPQAWQNDILVCEPTGYLVQRQVTKRGEIGWEGTRASSDEELIASEHPWFRPVDITLGPDGAIYVVDMCRAVIEHPAWAPEELRQRPDERDGNALGRIWRIASTQRGPFPQMPSPQMPTTASLTASAIVADLSHPNPLQRRLASRLCLQAETHEVGTVALLCDVLESGVSESVSAEGFARAWQSLSRMDLIEPHHITLAAEHGDWRVRRMVAAQLDELLSTHATAHTTAARDALPALLEDSDRWVRFEATGAVIRFAGIVSSETNEASYIDERTVELMADAILHAGDDTMWPLRFESTPPSLASRILSQLLDGSMTIESNRSPIVHRLARQSGMTTDRPTSVPVPSWFEATGDVEIQLACLAGWCNGLAAVSRRPDRREDAIAIAKAAFVDSSSGAATRSHARDVLVGMQADHRDELRKVARSAGPLDLRADSIGTLLSIEPTPTFDWLSTELAILEPEVRVAVTDVLVRDDAGCEQLLSWVEHATLPATFVSPDQANRLLTASNASIRERAEALFERGRSDRQALTQEYSGALTGVSNLVRGRQLFVTHCGACHHIDGVGTQVGPDISDSRVKTPEQILTAILDPNAAVDAGFTCYRWLTVDGQVQTGLLTKRDDERVSLQISGGTVQTARIKDLEILEPLPQSLMPEGFERVLTVDQMRDLIGYLKGWRYQDSDAFDLSRTR